VHAKTLPNCSSVLKSLVGPATLCLTLLFAGCSAAPTVPRLDPPVSLIEPTAEPVFVGSTNADLLQHIDDWRDALGQCNADKGALREFALPGR